jgi:hypothetical protein
MGQLIKLQDYISRYEMDIFTYPSRFVRLKKQQWERTLINWENEGRDSSNLTFYQPVSGWEEETERPALLKKLTDFFKHNHKSDENEILENPIMNEEDSLDFTASFSFKPESVEELKRQFLDQLYRFQLKWASSTITERSPIHSKYYFEENLKFFLQRFPDTYLVLYKPVFLLKKATLEAEIILLTPTDAWCITFIEAEDSAVFIGSNDRFWVKRTDAEEKKVLNPLLTLNRTEKIVRNIFNMHEIEFPIHKLLISRNGYIDYPSAPFGVEFAEARNFNVWFQSMRTLKSPLKHIQLKAAKVLLQYCHTRSRRRPEWELEVEDNQ